MYSQDRDVLKDNTARAMEVVWDQYDGTKEQLAEAVDVNVSTIYRWNNGERVITGSNVVRLSEETGVDKSEFRPDLFGDD